MAAAPLPAPPRRSALLRLVQPLLDLVARERAAGGLSADMLWATDAAASVLLALLTCVRSGRLALGDADALRLLSAAPVVLRVQPQALRVFAESCHNGGLGAEDLSEAAHPSRMVEINVQAVSLLVAEAASPDPHLPPRALAAARATSLRPQALKDWLCGPGSVLDAIVAFLPIIGGGLQGGAPSARATRAQDSAWQRRARHRPARPHVPGFMHRPASPAPPCRRL